MPGYAPGECRGLPKTSQSDDSQKYSVMCHQHFSNGLTEYQKKVPRCLTKQLKHSLLGNPSFLKEILSLSGLICQKEDGGRRLQSTNYTQHQTLYWITSLSYQQRQSGLIVINNLTPVIFAFPHKSNQFWNGSTQGLLRLSFLSIQSKFQTILRVDLSCQHTVMYGIPGRGQFRDSITISLHCFDKYHIHTVFYFLVIEIEFSLIDLTILTISGDLGRQNVWNNK